MENLSPNAKAVLDLVEILDGNDGTYIVIYNGIKRTGLTEETLDLYLCGIYAGLH